MVKRIDRYGTTLSYTFNDGQSTYRTYFGALLTLVTFTFVIAYFVQKAMVVSLSSVTYHSLTTSSDVFTVEEPLA